MKYKVKAIRRETYVADFEVEADNILDAVTEAEKVVNEGDSEFFGEVADADEWIEGISIAPDREVRDPLQDVS